MNTNDQTPIGIRYEQTTIINATQFLISGDDEQLILDGSSGPIRSEDGESAVLPIHTRLGMTWSAARRLTASLNEAMRRHETGQLDVPDTSYERQDKRQAGLPRIDDAHI